MTRPPRLLVTAGPTHEALDPVRFLANRSSGKMGFAIATQAARRGWEVILVAGPVHLPTPEMVTRVDVVSAADMFSAVKSVVHSCQAAILAAAVADFRPAQAQATKIKKGSDATLTLELVRTPDILGSLRTPIGFRGVLVGFAAETDHLEANAAAKLAAKGCDLLVANDVSRPDIGFGTDDNEVVLFHRAPPRTEPLPKAGKFEIADAILNRVAALLAPAT